MKKLSLTSVHRQHPVSVQLPNLLPMTYRRYLKQLESLRCVAHSQLLLCYRFYVWTIIEQVYSNAQHRPFLCFIKALNEHNCPAILCDISVDLFSFSMPSSTVNTTDRCKDNGLLSHAFPKKMTFADFVSSVTKASGASHAGCKISHQKDSCEDLTAKGCNSSDIRDAIAFNRKSHQSLLNFVSIDNQPQQMNTDCVDKTVPVKAITISSPSIDLDDTLHNSPACEPGFFLKEFAQEVSAFQWIC